jgi:hypothetical protein
MKTPMLKPPSSVLLLAAFGLLTNLHADLTLVQKIDGVGQDMETTTNIKPGKMRVDTSATVVIMDLKTGSLTSLMPAEKKYMKIPSQMAQVVFDSMKKSQGDQTPAPPVPTPTGKKETINGFACEEYNFTYRGSKGTLWLTTALPGYQAALQEMAAAFTQGPMAAMVKNIGVDFTALPGFPIRTVTELKPGDTITSTTVSVSTKPIPDAEFDIPAGYTEMKMPSLTPPDAAQPPALSR